MYMLILKDPLLVKQSRSTKQPLHGANKCETALFGFPKEKTRELKGKDRDELRRYLSSLKNKYAQYANMFDYQKDDGSLDKNTAGENGDLKLLQSMEGGGASELLRGDFSKTIVLIKALHDKPTPENDESNGADQKLNQIVNKKKEPTSAILEKGGGDNSKNDGGDEESGDGADITAQASVKDVFRSVKGKLLNKIGSYSDPTNGWTEKDREKAADLLVRFAQGSRLSGTEATTARAYVKHLDNVAYLEPGISSNSSSVDSAPPLAIYKMGLDTLKAIDGPTYRSPASKELNSKLKRAFDAAKITLNFLTRESKKKKGFMHIAPEDERSMEEEARAGASLREAFNMVGRKLKDRVTGKTDWNEGDTETVLALLSAYVESGPGSVSGQYAKLLSSYVKHLSSALDDIKAFKGIENFSKKPSQEQKQEGLAAVKRYEQSGGVYNHTVRELNAFASFIQYMTRQLKEDPELSMSSDPSKAKGGCELEPPIVNGEPIYHLSPEDESAGLKSAKKLIKQKVDPKSLPAVERIKLKKLIYDALGRFFGTAGTLKGGEATQSASEVERKEAAEAFSKYYPLGGNKMVHFKNKRDRASYELALALLKAAIESAEGPFRFLDLREPNLPPLRKKFLPGDVGARDSLSGSAIVQTSQSSLGSGSYALASTKREKSPNPDDKVTTKVQRMRKVIRALEENDMSNYFVQKIWEHTKTLYENKKTRQEYFESLCASLKNFLQNKIDLMSSTKQK